MGTVQVGFLAVEVWRGQVPALELGAVARVKTHGGQKPETETR